MKSQVHPHWFGFVLHYSGEMWVYREDEYIFAVGPRKAGIQ